MVYIYCITNNITNESYVGKTERDIQKRFKEHMHKSKNMKTQLCESIRKYGENNFSIKCIEEVDEALGDSKEIEWINKLGTVKNGLNMSYGGKGKTLYNAEDKKFFAEEYINGKQVYEIAFENNCCPEMVSIAIKENGIEIDRTREKTSKNIAMYDKENNHIKNFSSIQSAAFYLIENSLANGSPTGVAQKISYVANGVRKTAYNHIWRYLN